MLAPSERSAKLNPSAFCFNEWIKQEDAELSVLNARDAVLSDDSGFAIAKPFRDAFFQALCPVVRDSKAALAKNLLHFPGLAKHGQGRTYVN